MKKAEDNLKYRFLNAFESRWIWRSHLGQVKNGIVIGTYYNISSSI